MDYKMTAASAANRALVKLGYSCCQTMHTNESIFDCSPPIVAYVQIQI